MLNRCFEQGRFTADPELRHTGDGTPVCSFSLAVERSMKDRNGERRTDFINFIAWGQRAEFICTHLRKGQQVIVGGPLQQRRYKDKNGEERTAYEIHVDDINFCGPRHQNDAEYGGAAAPSDDLREITQDEEGELPF